MPKIMNPATGGTINKDGPTEKNTKKADVII